MGEDVVILGLGNVLLGDDGAGVAALHRLARSVRPDPRVALVDGGTLGLSLLDYFEAGAVVILIDAVLADAAPGSLIRLEGGEVAGAVEARLSPHQVGVADLLAAADCIGRTPRLTVLVGVVPGHIGVGIERTPEVERAIPALVDAVIDEVARAGITLAREADDARHRLDVSDALGL